MVCEAALCGGAFRRRVALDSGVLVADEYVLRWRPRWHEAMEWLAPPAVSGMKRLCVYFYTIDYVAISG